MSDEKPPITRRRRIEIIVLGAVLAVVAIVADQVTKALALEHLSETERIPLLGDLFGLQLAFNTGASFSLGSEFTIVISIVGIVAVIGLAVAITRTRSRLWGAGFGLVLGGAAGNLVDRFLSDPGGGRGPVTDMLAYGNWFIGNIADLLIGVGVGLLILAAIRRPTAAAATAPVVLDGDESESDEAIADDTEPDAAQLDAAELDSPDSPDSPDSLDSADTASDDPEDTDGRA